MQRRTDSESHFRCELPATAVAVTGYRTVILENLAATSYSLEFFTPQLSDLFAEVPGIVFANSLETFYEILTQLH